MKSGARKDEALRVVEMERDGLRMLADIIHQDADFEENFSACLDLLLPLKGHLIVVGVGKSGHVGQKLAASFASTGTPSFFMHPTEASHGDLGMVTPQCVVLALSNSGESAELEDVLHYCRKTGVPVIGITRNPASMLGKASTHVLRLPSSPEACSNGLAPTTSTTNTLALGDALVIATMKERGVSRDDFGRHHPGGKLGRGLQTVEDWIQKNPHETPTVPQSAPIADVALALSSGQSGCVAVLDDDDQFTGMITDGDLRRAFDPSMFERTAIDIANMSPTTLTEDQLMSDVVDILTKNRLATAFVLRDEKPVAVVNLKSLVAQGYV